MGYVSAFTADDKWESICSGVQLSCGAVLTAAHCLRGSHSCDRGSFFTRYHAGDCGHSEDGHTWSFSTTIVMPGFHPSTSGSLNDLQIAHDIAILPLRADPDVAFRRTARSLPYARLGDVGSVLSGAVVSEVGYGAGARTDDGDCVVDEECNTKPGSVPPHGAYRKHAELSVGYVGGTWQAIRLQGINGSMAVPGDSGGPVLLGTDTVVGIQSSTNGTASAPCNATQAWAANLTEPGFAQWIREQLAALDRDGDEVPDACDPCPDVPDDGYDADGDHELATSIWHRISIDGPGIPSPSVEANPLDLDLNPYAMSTTRERLWRWEDDFAYWSSSAWGAELPYGVPTEPEQGRGRLWVHAQTLHGMDLADAEHGIHGRADDITVPQPGLANAVQDVSPIVTKTRYVIHKVLTKEPIRLQLTARPCLACGPEMFEQGAIERPSWGYPLAQAPGASPREAQQIVTVPGSDALAVLLRDGSLMDVSDTVGEGLRASLSLGLRWVDAAENEPAAGAGAHAPTAIGLSADGTSIVERAYLVPGGLLGESDISPTHGVLKSNGTTETSAPGYVPTPRVEPLAAYSRSTRQLFVVGGRDPDTGSRLTDIARADVATGVWTRIVPKGVTLGQVLATTYSPRDRKLWILDTLGAGRGATARLIRLDPGTGRAQTLGEWPRSGKFDKHWLILDRDASVLLATSSDMVNKHVVIHFDDTRPVPQADRTYAGQHALALPPVVDSEGYAFTTRIAPKKMPVVVRVKALSGGIGHWGGMGTCL